MSLVKRSNSKFWYVQFQFLHQTFVRSTRTTDRRTAMEVAAKMRAEVHAEIVLGRRKPATLSDALDRYVDSKTGTANHRNLLGHKTSILGVISGSTNLKALTPALIDQLCRKKAAEGLQPQTVKHLLNCLSAAVRKARRDGYQTVELEFPAIKIHNKMVRYLSAAEEGRLLQMLRPDREGPGLAAFDCRSPARQRWMQDNYDLVVMLLDTGARYSEIANIRWQQVDITNHSIRLWRSKVQNESVIFMTDRVWEILQRRKLAATAPFVFTSKSGGPRGYSAIAIRKALHRAGLADCTIHTLRHTHATRLIQNGLNVYEVREVLGHSDIKTTMRYAHLERAAVTQKARDVINKLNKPSDGRA